MATTYYWRFDVKDQNETLLLSRSYINAVKNSVTSSVDYTTYYPEVWLMVESAQNTKITIPDGKVVTYCSPVSDTSNGSTTSTNPTVVTFTLTLEDPTPPTPTSYGKRLKINNAYYNKFNNNYINKFNEELVLNVRSNE